VKIDKLDLRTGRREPFKTLTPPDVTAFAGLYVGRIAPDGKAYVYSYRQFPCILYVIEGLR